MLIWLDRVMILNSSLFSGDSADNPCIQFGPRSGPSECVGPDLDPNCLVF